MNFHIIIDHPWQGSFNFAILKAIIKVIDKNQREYDLLDLNREGFNPVMSEKELAGYINGKVLDPMVKEFQQRLNAADYLIFIFPIWWNVMPVMLKGWMDKVLLPGFAFTTGHVPSPLLKHIRGATVITSTSTSDGLHRKTYHNALKWIFCEGTLKFCGVGKVSWLNFGEAGFVSREQHADWIKFIESTIQKIIDENIG